MNGRRRSSSGGSKGPENTSESNWWRAPTDSPKEKSPLPSHPSGAIAIPTKSVGPRKRADSGVSPGSSVAGSPDILGSSRTPPRYSNDSFRRRANSGASLGSSLGTSCHSAGRLGGFSRSRGESFDDIGNQKKSSVRYGHPELLLLLPIDVARVNEKGESFWQTFGKACDVWPGFIHVLLCRISSSKQVEEQIIRTLQPVIESSSFSEFAINCVGIKHHAKCWTTDVRFVRQADQKAAQVFLENVEAALLSLKNSGVNLSWAMNSSQKLSITLSKYAHEGLNGLQDASDSAASSANATPNFTPALSPDDLTASSFSLSPLSLGASELTLSLLSPPGASAANAKILPKARSRGKYKIKKVLLDQVRLCTAGRPYNLLGQNRYETRQTLLAFKLSADASPVKLDTELCTCVKCKSCEPQVEEAEEPLGNVENETTPSALVAHSLIADTKKSTESKSPSENESD